jgi:ELWxxDGT repeat protein
MPLYFVGDDGAHGAQLWETNGSSWSMVSNVNSFSSTGDAIGFDAELADLTPYNGELYFIGNDGSHGEQLWATNGTTAGTQMLTSVNTGSGGLALSDLTACNGKLYFLAADGGFGTQLWVTNGAASGTSVVAGNPNFEITSLVAVGGELYFIGSDSTQGKQLWASNGTGAGTVLLTDVNTAPDIGGEVHGLSISNMFAVGNTLFFVGDNGTAGPQLWASNSSGTHALTIVDITPFPGTTDAPGFAMSNFTSFDGDLYFTGDDGVHGPQLWVSNGVTVSNLTFINTGASITGGDAAGFAESSFTVSGSNLFFIGNDGAHGAQLWVTNTAGTSMLTDDYTVSDLGDVTGLQITDMTAAGGKMFFVATDSTRGTQIWVSNGNQGGVVVLTQGDWRLPVIGAFTIGPAFTSVFGYNGKFYFVADDGVHGRQLWDTDGTPADTIMITDVNSASSGSDAVGFGPQGLSNFSAVGGKVYFTGSDRIHGLQLWETDGTAAGTFMVTNSSGFSNSGLTNLTPAKPEVHANLQGHALSDILIENTVGAVDAGELGSGGMFAYNAISSLGPEWSFGGVGDYYGDGKSQFLIENTSSAVDIGEVGASGTAVYTAVSALGPEWRFVGSGDFLGLGKSEFLIENTVGAVDVGTVSSSKTTSYTPVATLASQWSVVESGDFYGDGKTQFLIESTAGVVEVGEVGSNNQAALVQVAALGPEWRFVGAGDFLGIGKDQVLIENTAGAVDVGTVGSNNTVTYTAVASLGPEWKFVGDGDYYGTGTASFLIENTSGAVDTGTVVGGVAQYAAVASLGPEWSFKG